jgi:hypothetical protein
MALIAGCQTPGKVVATETSSACPKCQLETKTRSIKGVTYKTDVCPSCKTTWDPWGGSNHDENAIVHVCDECKIMTEKCAVCAQKK